MFRESCISLLQMAWLYSQALNFCNVMFPVVTANEVCIACSPPMIPLWAESLQGCIVQGEGPLICCPDPPESPRLLWALCKAGWSLTCYPISSHSSIPKCGKGCLQNLQKLTWHCVFGERSQHAWDGGGGSANCFCKSQMVNILGCGHAVSATTTQFCHCHVRVSIDI